MLRYEQSTGTAKTTQDGPGPGGQFPCTPPLTRTNTDGPLDDQQTPGRLAPVKVGEPYLPFRAAA